MAKALSDEGYATGMPVVVTFKSSGQGAVVDAA